MNIEHTDFIGVYEGALSKEACEGVIQDFERHATTNPPSIVSGSEQYGGSKWRNDYSIFAQGCMPKTAEVINTALQTCVNVYSEKFFFLKEIRATSDIVKLQRTPPQGGYHIWHAEAMDRGTAHRVLVWIIYLNDIPDGEGETEFLWQGVRVKPKAGTCVLWPAAFTHPHRGNPVYSCDKYIATGWYTYSS